MTVAAPHRPEPAPTQPAKPATGRNLLDNRAVGAVLRSRWYPGALQIPVAAVFGLVAYQLLVGPDAAHDNALGAVCPRGRAPRTLREVHRL